VCIDNDSALRDALEEVEFVEEAFISKVEESQIFEEEGVHAGLGRCLVLYLLQKFCFEPT
jgi:hypothetical protein